MLSLRILILIAAMHDQQNREETARALAIELGARNLLIFTPDPELGMLLPAPGFTQTLAHRREWQEFLDATVRDRRHTAALIIEDREMPAFGVAAPDGAVMVLLEGDVNQELLDEILLLSPLLSSVFTYERTVITASGYALAARKSAESASQLAASLDSVRRDLHLALNRAQQALRERDTFVSVAAHELATPITSLKGMAQLSLRWLDRSSAPDPGRLREIIQRIDRQATKVSDLVQQLLDVTRLESGHLPISPSNADVVALVRDVVEMGQFSSQKHHLVLHAPDELVANIDQARVEQVLTNLVSNAIKYSPEGGTIDVDVRQQNDHLIIEIRDEGLGIPDSMHEKIFDRFQRGHPSNSMSGLGIGLYVSRQIVRQHGGEIRASNRSDRAGAQFVVMLPLKQAPQVVITPG